MSTFQEYHLSDRAKIITDTLPGPKSQEIIARQMAREGAIVSYPRKMPIAIRKAKGAIIEDADGNHFIDFFGGAGVLNTGHGNPYVMEYVKRQQEELIHVLDFPTENKADLIDKVLDQLPEGMRDQYKVNFCGPTGSDAIEAAIKLAKIKTGREGVIAFHGSYHGMTSGALAVTSDINFRHKVKSLMPNVSFMPYSYCYRCPFQKEKESCGMECAEYLRYVLENPHSGQNKPAAILLEPVQGEGGTVIPKPGYLEKIVEIAHKHDVVVIFDEIQSGFYRTGTFWAFQDGKAMPDIITMSKGLGGVGFPISAVIYNKSVEAWGPGDHIGTFRGNQVSIAAGNGAMDFAREYDLASHTRFMGAYLQAGLKKIQNHYPVIGDVRVAGLMAGIEYNKAANSHEPDADIVKALRKACFERGLLFEVGGHYANVIRFLPPLILTKELIDDALAIFEAAHASLLADSHATKHTDNEAVV